ncbi:MAG: RNA-binding protein [Bacteroidetes bacterium]|nr:RNA-binding protein [Bacteroidota bacterium]
MNIFVAKLSSVTNDEGLRNLFEQYGTVDTVKVIYDRETGNSKMYGFVEMPDDSQATTAIESLNETDFEGSKIVVKQARPREQNTRFRRQRRD